MLRVCVCVCARGVVALDAESLCVCARGVVALDAESFCVCVCV